MAYRFDGTDDFVTFAIGALSTLTEQQPVTIAAIVKRNGTGTWDGIFAGLSSAPEEVCHTLEFNTSNLLAYWPGEGASPVSTTAVTSTAVWQLVAVTWDGTDNTNPPRFHILPQGGSWTHESGSAAINYSNPAHSLDEALYVGAYHGPSDWFNGDIVCVGVDKANHTDGEIEGLTFAGIADWVSFGFDWLVGFEASGTIVDRSTTGTGDETARTGTTLVSDPSGWSWGAGDIDITGVAATATAAGSTPGVTTLTRPYITVTIS